MTYITSAYATRSELAQENCEEPVETLSLGDVLAEADKRLTFNQLRYFICQDFDHGVTDGETALNRLWDNGLIRNAEDLAFLVSTGVRALAEKEPRP